MFGKFGKWLEEQDFWKTSDDDWLEIHDFLYEKGLDEDEILFVISAVKNMTQTEYGE